MSVVTAAAFSRLRVPVMCSVRPTCNHKLLRAWKVLPARLLLAMAIGCGNTSSLPKLGPSISTTLETCSNSAHILPPGSSTFDLQINGVNCVVDGSAAGGTYIYRNVNIWNGGSLTFADMPKSPQISFHAHSILVEMNGTLQAGTTSGIAYPLTIWLWGASSDGIPSVTCLSDSKNQCGVSDADWNSNPNVPMKQMPMTPCTPATPALKLPNNDCFYQYEALETNAMPGAYFGSKVLAVSAGGSLMLRGAKGIRLGPGPAPEPIEMNPADSGTSWGRLTTTLNGGETSFTIDRAVPTWAAGDHIVVTTTDYLPGHTEEMVITGVANNTNSNSATITVQTPVKWPHYGKTYDYSAVVANNPAAGPTPDMNVTNLLPHNIETRAIVALLTRNIVIASEGATPMAPFPATAGTYYGGSTVAREGFTAFQVQGVEFYELGLGGYIGHYPVHFHMDRSVPQPNPPFLGTYVADSSIVDSMTRFIVVHATQGVTLARNVGYKSIGHGFYLEDATETDNRLYSNAAISVRGALADAQTNPRMVPGILDLPIDQINMLPLPPAIPNRGPNPPPVAVNQQIPDVPPYTTDVTAPSAFWIMNNWNDFEYNAAVGVGTCGACYWMVPGGIVYPAPSLPYQGGPSKYETWTGYAGMQKASGYFGAVPLMKFEGNSCSASMNSIMTIGATSQCAGVFFGDGNLQSNDTTLYSIPNPNSVTYDDYPAENNGRAKATLCDSAHPPRQGNDCSTAIPCAGTNGDEGTCAATVIDHYTTSFNWAQTNLAAIWLRAWWYELSNSAITDVQNGGLTFVSGGGYSRSDAPQGYWSVLKNSILVGNTQQIIPNTGFPANPFASNAGPFNPATGLICTGPADHCASVPDGISFQGGGFAVNQRLFSIYDGPTQQYSNIYSDVHPTTLGTLGQCKPAGNSVQGACAASLPWFNGFQNGVLQQVVGDNPPNSPSNNCILPNAAIAWKQPNGFYYPPAFDSDNLVFNDVDIRHFVIQPIFLPGGGYVPDLPEVQNTYCTWTDPLERSFTDIDRQTELTDNDGSLTGLTSSNTQATPPAGPTISITKDPFFDAPLATDECASGQLSPAKPTDNGAGATVSTSPYEYVTTAIINQCATEPLAPGTCGASPWAARCQDGTCYGVPLYRQSVTQTELNAIQMAPTNLTKRPAIRMAGQGTGQRSTLTLNHAHYYIDTSLSQNAQAKLPTFPPKFPSDANPLQVSNFNVFQGGQTYTVFFVFGKTSTKQSYSLYIGTGLSQPQAQAVMVPARVVVPGQFTVTPSPGSSWATFGSYDMTTGVLTVNVDLSGATDLNPQEAFCQPTSFCTWKSNNTCGCTANSGCTDDQVCSYATKDIDCPVAGCYGFNLTMPSGFTATDNGITPPMPDLFQNTDPYFQQVTFVNATQSVAGECYYQNPPTQTSVEPQEKSQAQP